MLEELFEGPCDSTSADVKTNVHLLGVLGNAVVVALDICIQKFIGSLLI
jgi:hypothetical protein